MKPLAAALALLAGAPAPGPARAAYPDRPITMIVPFAAGRSHRRRRAHRRRHMSRTLGQQIVVENVAGAGGTTGITRGAQSTPDGYTIMMGHMGTHGAAPAVYPDLKYDPVKDFEPIGLAAGTPIVIVAKKDFPAKDLKEFVAYVKANSTKLNEAHAGVGSVSFTTCSLLNSLLGREADAGGVPRHRPRPERPRRRPGGLHVRPDREPRPADPGGHDQGVRGGAARSARPRCRTCRPRRRAGCPSTRCPPGTRSSRRRGRRQEVVKKLSDALLKALDDARHGEAAAGPRRRPLEQGGAHARRRCASSSQSEVAALEQGAEADRRGEVSRRGDRVTRSLGGRRRAAAPPGAPRAAAPPGARGRPPRSRPARPSSPSRGRSPPRSSRRRRSSQPGNTTAMSPTVTPAPDADRRGDEVAALGGVADERHVAADHACRRRSRRGSGRRRPRC